MKGRRAKFIAIELIPWVVLVAGVGIPMGAFYDYSFVDDWTVGWYSFITGICLAVVAHFVSLWLHSKFGTFKKDKDRA